MKRILIVRPDGIGDFVIFSAVLGNYAEHFAGCRIDILCAPKVREAAEAAPFFCRIFCVSYKIKDIPARLLLLSSLNARRYDTVVYPLYSRSADDEWMIRHIRAKEKIAFDGNGTRDPAGRRFLRNGIYTRVIESWAGIRPELERNAEFAAKLAGRGEGPAGQTRFWFSDGDGEAARRLFSAHGLRPGNYVCASPGAGQEYRCWPESSWAEGISGFLRRRPGLKVVVLGSVQDRRRVRRILGSLTAPERAGVADLCGRTGLRVAAKFIQHARLSLAGETAAAHMAVALGTPSVCIMGGGHFERFHPRGDPALHRVVCRPMDCFGCEWNCLYKDCRCVTSVTCREVLFEAERLLGDRDRISADISQTGAPAF